MLSWNDFPLQRHYVSSYMNRQAKPGQFPIFLDQTRRPGWKKRKQDGNFRLCSGFLEIVRQQSADLQESRCAVGDYVTYTFFFIRKKLKKKPFHFIWLPQKKSELQLMWVSCVKDATNPWSWIILCCLWMEKRLQS